MLSLHGNKNILKGYSYLIRIITGPVEYQHILFPRAEGVPKTFQCDIMIKTYYLDKLWLNKTVIPNSKLILKVS